MYRTIVTIAVVFALLVGVMITSDGQAFQLFGRHKSVSAVAGEVHLPVTGLDDGKAHYYVYKDGKADIKFFVIQSNDGILRAAFDTCDVCFRSKKGYSQDGEFMICNKCGMRFHASQINVVEGGCNPAPLTREIVGDKLVIKIADIRPGARFF